MNTKAKMLGLLALTLIPSLLIAQQPCPNCVYPQQAIVHPAQQGQSLVDVPCRTLVLELSPLDDDSSLDLTRSQVFEAARQVDRFEQVIRATVRVTVSGTCGSGTVVGRDGDGHAIVLTNAHVAGTQKGRVVDVQRWNTDGTTEKGKGKLIAAGYGRGLSVDFALLQCPGFATDVVPVPLADRYPDVAAGVTTYGCPRCEWPSLQVLRMTRNEGQVLRWQPEAIGGRSGSSLIDYTEGGPRVVGLLTWGGGGEGLGQSTPFLLDAMRGRLPKAFDMLPDYAIEVSAELPEGIRPMPCDSCSGCLLAMMPQSEVDATTDQDVIDSILEPPPTPDSPGDGAQDGDDCEPAREGPLARLFGFLRRSIITILLVVLAAVAAYFFARRN